MLASKDMVLYVTVNVQILQNNYITNFDILLTVHLNIQGVTGGTDQTSGGCSLC